MPIDYGLLEFFANLVIVTFRTVAGYHLADESGKEKLESKENGYECQIEQRLFCNRTIK